jgi:hypothetical protein
VQTAVWEAMTDLYAILPLGTEKRGRKYVAVPLLKKKGVNRARKPGLTGAALEAAVDRFVARVPHALGSRLN